MVMQARETKVRPGYKLTEVGVIPEEWEVVILGSITLLLTNGFVGKATDFYTESDDGLLYIQGYNVKENAFNLHGIKRVTRSFHAQHQKSCLQSGDLLTIQTGDIGVTAVVPQELAGANCHALIITRLDKRFYVSQYFCQYFNSKRGREAFREIETGSTMKHLNVGDVKNLFFPLPPLPEQQAIAAALSDVDALLTSLDQLIAKKRDIKQATMQQLLSGRMRLPGFSGEWTVEKVGEFSEVGRGRVISHREIAASFHSTYPVYSSQTSSDGIMGYIDTYDFEGEYITWTTDGVNAGTVFYRNGRFNCTNVCGTIKLQKHNSFFVAQMLGTLAKQYVSTNLANPKLMNDVMKQIPVLLPPTLAEQTAIATVLTDMDAEIVALEHRREKTRALKQGMMQELLTGKTRLL